MEKQTNLPYVFPIFEGSVEVYVSVLVIVISDVQVPCEFLFFFRIQVYAQNMEEKHFKNTTKRHLISFLWIPPMARLSMVGYLHRFSSKSVDQVDS